MSEAFHIRRLRLVNFHNFVDETLSVRRNLFLIGDNQSGKTTVLDGVHFALSAGVEMEFNAATRFGPRSEPGRNLASIVLRYDLERDQAGRGPSIAYAVLELEDAAGEHSCCGAGAFVTSLDAQPDVWGFIARGVSLEDLGLVVVEPDRRTRPRDRQELEETLGRGNVFEKGRYRSALGQFLFRDRDAYLRGLDLIGAAKAYRELVARSRSLNDLFVELLPPPAESEFDEVRSALRAIEGIRGNLAELDAEVAVLRRVVEKLQEARREHEKLARYEFVGTERARQGAEQQEVQAGQAAASARQAALEAEQALGAAQELVRALETAWRALRASADFTLLEREEEARRDLEAAQVAVAAAEQDTAQAQTQVDRARSAAAQARQQLDLGRESASRAIRAISDAVREYLDEACLLALGALADELALAEPAAVAAPCAELQRGFQSRRDGALEAAARAEAQAGVLRDQAEQSSRQAEEVRRRAEVLPDLPGYADLLARLETAGSRAVPLYRLFELAPGVPDRVGAAIECLLGPRVLGAIVAPEDEQPQVRALVLRHGEGIEVLEPSELRAATAAPAPGTLPAALAPADLEQPAALARAWLERLVGDVRILEAGAPRQALSQASDRVIWTDGYIYDLGAESRVEPGPPRFLGTEARRQAAAAEENRLLGEAAHLRQLAEVSALQAAAQREIAGLCRRCFEELAACSPDRLSGLVREVRQASAILAASQEAAQRASERLASASAQRRARRERHQELAAAVAGKGLADLRSRSECLETELQAARLAVGDARDALGRRQQAAETQAERWQQSRAALESAAREARERRELLLPLVDPRYQTDIEDYVFRVMRGHQINTENLPDLAREASNARARACESLSGSDGIRHELLWQRYALRLNEQALEVRDQSARPVEDLYAEREEQVQKLRLALDEKTRDLLERVVMAGLVRRLQNQTHALRETIRGVNRLAADLRFGASRFQFSIKPQPGFERLLDLLREQSVLQPALREELRDFFQARLDDLRQTGDREVPEILDYRRWFSYILQVTSREAGGPADLTRHRLRFGSGGEQAVPAYLLILAVASLLYDQTEARLRVLLLDEAFLGIDAGRREVLLQFADRARVDLVVATPELDGLTPALQASSTLFIEKTQEGDVFLSDYHWERPSPQAGLFDKPAPPREEDWVLGPRP